MVGAFHAEAGAEPPCEVKLDVVDDNYEGDAVFFKLPKKLSRYFKYYVSIEIRLQAIKLGLTRLHFNFWSILNIETHAQIGIDLTDPNFYCYDFNQLLVKTVVNHANW